MCEVTQMIYEYHKPDELYHHGILGQKWGKRNGPPYPLKTSNYSSTEIKAKISNKATNDIKSFERKYTTYNINKWGQDKQHNLLFITGLSGSGKSTLSEQIQKENNADLIHMDLYLYSTVDKYTNQQSKLFNKYLDKKVPEWKKMQQEAYDLLTKIDRRGEDKKAVGLWFDTFEDALKEYSKELYGKQKVIAEGVQILDETLFYNNKESLKEFPIIIMNTDIVDSILSRVYRDNKNIDKEFSGDKFKQTMHFQKGKEILESIMLKYKDIPIEEINYGQYINKYQEDARYNRRIHSV
jgi:adenylate kinase family enzyme